MKETCSVCNQDIEVPICNDCYDREFQLLLSELSLNQPISEAVLQRFRTRLFHLNDFSEEPCILCGRETVSICAPCFSKLCFLTTQRENVSPVNFSFKDPYFNTY